MFFDEFPRGLFRRPEGLPLFVCKIALMIEYPQIQIAFVLPGKSFKILL